MNKCIFILFLFFLITTATSQNTFEITIADTIDQEMFQVLETDGTFIVVSTKGYLPPIKSYHTQLLRIDQTGRILERKVCKPDVHYYSIFKLLEIEDKFLGFGYQQDSINSPVIISIFEMSKEFTFIREKQYITDYFGISYVEAITSGKNTIIFFSGIFEDYSTELCAYKINSDLDTILSKKYDDSGFNATFDVLVSDTNNLMKIFVRGLHQQTNTPCQIIILDNNLNFVEIKGVPAIIGNYVDVQLFDEHKYILTGKSTLWNANPPDDQMAIAYMNNSDSLLFVNMLGATDTLDFPGIFNNLGFFSNDTIYYAGTKNFSLSGVFSPTEAWFVLNKLNSNLELHWQKFYGGEANYQLIDMIATQDGGCLMAGNRYDYISQTYERDIYLIKVNADGLIVGNGELPGCLIAQDAIVYPNPGNEFLRVQSGPQINGALFELFNLNGKLVLSTTLDKRMVTINTSAVPPGTYPYRVTYQNKIVASGKWVKH